MMSGGPLKVCALQSQDDRCDGDQRASLEICDILEAAASWRFFFMSKDRRDGVFKARHGKHALLDPFHLAGRVLNSSVKYRRVGNSHGTKKTGN